MSAGEAAVEFLRETPVTAPVRLARDYGAWHSDADFYFNVSYGVGGWLVAGYTLPTDGAPSFSGSLNDLLAWASQYHAPDTIAGKVVKFYYEGGSQPGDRIVKVDTVTRTRSGLTIRGKDVMKDDHRSYSSEKIRGDIILLGG